MQANEDSASRLLEIRDPTGTAKLRVLNSGALAAHNAMFGATGAESYGDGERGAAGTPGRLRGDIPSGELTKPVLPSRLFASRVQGGRP
jgi:hypothetical protein